MCCELTCALFNSRCVGPARPVGNEVCVALLGCVPQISSTTSEHAASIIEHILPHNTKAAFVTTNDDDRRKLFDMRL